MYLQKALRGTIIAFIFTVLAGILWYLFRFLLAREVSLFEYGLFYSVVAFYSFLNLFVDAGFSQAVPKFMINFQEKKNDEGVRKVLLMSLAFQIFVSLFLFLIVFLLSDFLSSQYFHNDVSEILIVMGIWFITVPFTYMIGYVFVGRQKYGLASSIEFMRVFFTLIVSYILFRLGFGFYSPIMGFMAINLLLCLFYSPFILKLVHFSKGKSGLDISLFKSILRFGIFVSFSSIMWTILSQIDTMFLTFFSGIEAVGLYQAAVPLASVAMYFITAVTIVSYPLASELYAKKKLEELRLGINIFYRHILLILVPCLMLLFIYSNSIIYVLFGDKFVAASTALKILSIGAIFSSITLFNNNIISAVGQPKIVAKTMLYVALLNIVLCLILIPIFSINGAALATSSSFFAGAIISLFSLNKHIKTRIPWFDWIKTLIAGLIMISIIYVVRLWLHIDTLMGFAVLGSLAFLVYVLLCYAFGIVDVKELKFFFGNILK